MHDLVLADISPALIALYWICLIVGGGLLFISTVLGGDAHGDVGGDISLDTDVGTDFAGHGHAGGDVHADHAGSASLATWFSMQFMVFFMAVFGLLGIALTYFTGAGAGTTLVVAAGGGLFVGQGVHQLFRRLRRSSGNSATLPGDYVNKVGRVTVHVSDLQKGEVAVSVGQNERFLPAMSKREGTAFSRGETVAVVDYEGGIARVVSREEFEFLTNRN